MPKRKKPKLTCLYCKTWYELPVNDAREKVFIKTCRGKEIESTTQACGYFEPHDYFECPLKTKKRLHIEVCYNLCETKKCSKWRRCITGKLIKHIVETYRR